MMRLPLKAILGVGGVMLLASARKRASEATSDDETEEETQYAMTGYAAAEYELLSRGPVDLSTYEDAEPLCGRFYQSRRGDTWLGDHERSITYRALFRTAYVNGGDEKLSRTLAANPRLRKQLFDLCVGQQWGDGVYGTYLLSSKDPIGQHGRGIPLVRSCADNRQRILDGEAVVRVVPRGQPGDQGLGVPNRKMLHNTQIGPLKLAFPYVWLPALNIDELLAGRVTTRGMVWDDGSTGLEPPPVVWNLRIAELDHG